MAFKQAVQGERTYREIAEQPKAVEHAFEEAIRRRSWAESYFGDPSVRQTLFVGSGSSYYQSIAMAATCRSWLGREANALPSSDLLLVRNQVAAEHLRTVVVGVSRSGESTEVVKALASVEDLPDWRRAGVTCYGDSSMAALGDCLVTERGQEESTVMTKSLAGMIAGVQTAIASVAVDSAARLADLERMVRGQADRVSEGNRLAGELAAYRHFDRTIILGLGAMYGIALEGGLKLKEMANVWTESFGTLEFRHGPKSIVDPHTCVIALVSERCREPELKVAREMKEFGAFVVVIAAAESADTAFADLFVQTGLQGAADEARAVAALPFLQYYGYHTALKRGLDPDSPRNLTQVVLI